MNPHSIVAHHRFCHGPLMLGHLGDQAVDLTEAPMLVDEARAIYTAGQLELAPIGDMLDRPMTKDGYSRQILFRASSLKSSG
jgi:hypothetical protein